MKGDFSRITFDKDKHYSGVRMQQGRVQLDADWNEQIDIINYHQQTHLTDLVGKEGCPIDNAGYEIIVINEEPGKLYIIHGRYYVDGLLCETAGGFYTLQPDYSAELPPAGLSNNIYIAYLDVWQRTVLSFEDSAIREVALGGADTCTRIQTVAQVKLLPIANVNSNSEWEALTSDSISLLGGLAASVDSNRNLQDQLYRIEIHQAGDNNTATFKWSRDNAPQVEVIGIEGNIITINSIHAISTKFSINQYVELSNRTRELKGEAGPLLRIINVEGNQLTVDLGTPPATIADCTYARLWDSSEVIVKEEGTLNPIENGLKVDFFTANYKTGAYWLISSRAYTNNITWPLDEQQPPQPQFLFPFSQHHYARLAVLVQDSNNDWETVRDERKFFATSSSFLEKHAWPISLGSMYPALTNGATIVQVESATNKNNYRGWSFSQVNTNSLHFRIPMPKSWNKGKISFVPIWITTVGGSSNMVTWGIECLLHNNNDIDDASFGAQVLFTNNATSNANATIIGSESPMLLPNGTPQDNSVLEVRISRVPSDEDDNLPAPVILIGLTMFIKTDKGNDA